MAVNANIGILDPRATDDQLLSIEPIEGVDWRHELPEGPDYYWRFHGFVDFWGADPVGSICVERWTVLRRTPKGVWLRHPFSYDFDVESGKKLVIHDTNRKWAYPTKKEAWESFKIRLMRREQHWDREGERIAALKRIASAEDDS